MGRTIDIVYGERAKLDKKDKKILEMLYKDGRMPVSMISKKTGIGRDSIKHRLRKMIKNDVISYIRPTLNPPRMGYPLLNYVVLSINKFNLAQEKKFLNFLKVHNNIIYVGVVTGKWDYVITIAAKNPEHFSEVMKDIKSSFSSFIKDYDIMTIVKEPKYDEMLGLLD